MTANPMQRKANMYLLMGVLFTLLVTIPIIVFLIIRTVSLKNQMNKNKESKQSAYIVNKDIKSGNVITDEDVETILVDTASIPSDALTDAIIKEKNENNIDLVAKIDLKSGTVITEGMLYAEGKEIADDLRTQEYNMLSLPVQIEEGEYIDVRLRLPNGTDYLVVSKKRVELPTIGGVESANTIKINISEDETLLMSNAIVEAYAINGSVLYVAKYVEAGLQNDATPTYQPSVNVRNLIKMDPNIVDTARKALQERYDKVTQDGHKYGDIIRSYVESLYTEDAGDNIAENVEKEIEKGVEQRQMYLESLAAEE